jgi:threonine aldolase
MDCMVMLYWWAVFDHMTGWSIEPVIDLRSDTVTLPSPAMREAMAHAEVGDDMYGEDPTVNRLEALAAEKMGKEAAVLVTSGTMGNLASLLAHCQRGQRVILGTESHIFHYETSGAAALGSLSYHLVPNQPDGTLEPVALAEALASDHVHDALHISSAGVVCLEDTHNRCGGAVLTPEYLLRVRKLAQDNGLPLHLDGARIFNAAVALELDVREFTQHADSVQFCLSKGLSAPVGSMVVGSEAFVRRVRIIRKMLGGAMRQAGVIAAAGIVALNDMVDRLAEDHANASILAEELASVPGIDIDLAHVQSNMVMFRLTEGRMAMQPFIAALKEQGVLVGTSGPNIRAVTHYGISEADVRAAAAAIEQVLS